MADTDTDPDDTPALITRLAGLRHTLLQLVAELHIVAQRAELFASRRRPNLSGTPQLKAQRDALARLYEQVVTMCGRRRGPAAEELFELLTAFGERPPRPVTGAAYTFAAVVRVALAVRSIGWDDGTKQLRGARDPWHKRTPAQRLSKAELWVWAEVPLPYFGDPAVVAEFNAALTREFDRAEHAARAHSCTSNRTSSRHTSRGNWSRGIVAGVEQSREEHPSSRKSRRVSDEVMADTLAVFGPGEHLARADVIERMREVNTVVCSGQTSRALKALVEDGRLRKTGGRKYTRG